jgi:IS6 family transposase
MAAGRICTGPSTAGAALSFISPPVVSKAAYRFLGKILNNVKKWQIPRFINTDKAPAYGRALALLNAKAGARLTLNTDRLSTGTT